MEFSIKTGNLNLVYRKRGRRYIYKYLQSSGDPHGRVGSVLSLSLCFSVNLPIQLSQGRVI